MVRPFLSSQPMSHLQLIVTNCCGGKVPLASRIILKPHGLHGIGDGYRRCMSSLKMLCFDFLASLSTMVFSHCSHRFSSKILFLLPLPSVLSSCPCVLVTLVGVLGGLEWDMDDVRGLLGEMVRIVKINNASVFAHSRGRAKLFSLQCGRRCIFQFLINGLALNRLRFVCTALKKRVEDMLLQTVRC